MGGAVEGTLVVVPFEDGAEVGADGRAGVETVAAVAVYGELFEALADDGALSGLERFDGIEVARREPAAVAVEHPADLVQVIDRSVLQDGAVRVVDGFPFVGFAVDEVGDQHGTDRGVGDAVPAVAGNAVHVVGARVAADEPDAVDRIEGLSRPLRGDVPDAGEMLLRPGMQAMVALLLGDLFGVFLAGAVVFAADDQQVVAVRSRFGAHVMVGPGDPHRVAVTGIPPQSGLDAAFRDARRDGIRPVGPLLHLQAQRVVVVDGGVRCDDDVLRSDRDPVHFGAFGSDVVGFRLCEDGSAHAEDGFTEPLEVAQRVELCLLWEADAALGGAVGQDGGVCFDRGRHPEPLQCGDLVGQRLLPVARVQEEVAVGAAEMTVDAFPVHGVFDEGDGRLMAVGDAARFVFPEHLFQLRIAFPERVGQVGGRAARFAASDEAVFDEDDPFAAQQEVVGGRDTGYSATDHQHFCFVRCGKRFEPGRGRGKRPCGGIVAGGLVAVESCGVGILRHRYRVWVCQLKLLKTRSVLIFLGKVGLLAMMNDEAHPVAVLWRLFPADLLQVFVCRSIHDLPFAGEAGTVQRTVEGVLVFVPVEDGA